MNSPEISKRPIGLIEALIIFVAIIGFAFDIYELLMMPLIAGPAISELLKVPLGDPKVREWVGYIFWGVWIAWRLSHGPIRTQAGAHLQYSPLFGFGTCGRIQHVDLAFVYFSVHHIHWCLR
jgi:hypothetical protein